MPLSGPVFLPQLPGQVLPGLRMALAGPVSLAVTGCTKPAATLTLRGDRLKLTVAAGGARRVSATLSDGAFTGRKRTGFVLETLDVSGRSVTQRLRARR